MKKFEIIEKVIERGKEVFRVKNTITGKVYGFFDTIEEAEFFAEI
jgi:hypothetical protein